MQRPYPYPVAASASDSHPASQRFSGAGRRLVDCGPRRQCLLALALLRPRPAAAFARSIIRHPRRLASWLALLVQLLYPGAGARGVAPAPLLPQGAGPAGRTGSAVPRCPALLRALRIRPLTNAVGRWPPRLRRCRGGGLLCAPLPPAHSGGGVGEEGSCACSCRGRCSGRRCSQQPRRLGAERGARSRARSGADRAHRQRRRC
jgi:hypothetical protein